MLCLLPCGIVSCLVLCPVNDSVVFRLGPCTTHCGRVPCRALFCVLICHILSRVLSCLVPCLRRPLLRTLPRLVSCAVASHAWSWSALCQVSCLVLFLVGMVAEEPAGSGSSIIGIPRYFLIRECNRTILLWDFPYCILSLD